MVTTFTTTGPEDARIAAAVGNYLNLGGNANAAQVKGVVINLLIQIVLNYEKNLAVNAAIAATIPIAPT